MRLLQSVTLRNSGICRRDLGPPGAMISPIRVVSVRRGGASERV